MVVVSSATENREGQGTGPDSNPVPRSTRPAILYGYGGFNISLTPAFSAGILAWVEAGGVYAIAGLRGGSEEGEQWHRAGMREHKQNVFDDFHAAAEKLIADGWTTSSQLTVWGGSNGGLLVGASITQRPDLSAAAVCSAALLDMVRYERFGLGETWNDEFGTAADPTEFGWLISYSPYHHVRPGVDYPAVLFTISDGDTRVDTAARPQDVRSRPVRHRSARSRPAGAPAERGPGRPRRPRPQPVYRAVSRDAGVRRGADRLAPRLSAKRRALNKRAGHPLPSRSACAARLGRPAAPRVRPRAGPRPGPLPRSRPQRRIR